MLDGHHVVDLHTDLLETSRRWRRDPTIRHRRLPPLIPFGHTDFPRLREGGVDLIITSAYGPRARGEDAWAITQATFAFTVDRLSRDGQARLVTTSGEARAAAADGVLGVALALEGGHLLGNRPERVASLRERGLMSVGLAHMYPNGVADTCGIFRRRERGSLSALGREIVAACREAGVLVDLAHAHPDAFADVLALDDGPVYVTHAGANRAHPKGHHNRLLDDDQIREVARRGGVVGVIYIPYFLRSGLLGEPGAVVDHLEAIAEVGGPETPALGSDWDGGVMTRSLEEPKGIAWLVDIMQRRGWRDEHIAGALGGNFLRFWERAVTRP